jgi:hypothetical protein
MSLDPNSFLLGGGTKSASFKGNPPITYSGPIVAEPKVSQQTDYDTYEPLTWPNGDPRLQLVVQIQTDERDPSDQADDGVRALYLKANSQKAVAAAVRASGAQGLAVGGVLSLTYTGDDTAAQKGRLAPPKLYTATYTPPTAAQAAQFLGTDQPADGSPEAWLRANGHDPATFGSGANLASIVELMKQTNAQKVS